MSERKTLSEVVTQGFNSLTSTADNKSVEKTFTTTLVKHDLTFVDGDTETVEAHEFKEKDGRISFRAHAAPILSAHDGNFTAHSWFSTEIKGFGNRSIKNWDKEVIETDEVTIETEVFDGVLVPKCIEIDDEGIYGGYDEYTVVEPISKKEEE